MEFELPTTQLIEYSQANNRVREIYDDIMSTRNTDWVNNFWKALAPQPDVLERTWKALKSVMAPGKIDTLTKELIYIAVSVTNSCNYCTNSHMASARTKGMDEEMLTELLSVVGMANQTNALANGLQVEVDTPYIDGGLKSN